MATVHGAEGFTVKEFLRPGEAPPETPGTCLLCLRKNVCLHYYAQRFSGSAAPGIVQPHRNIINEPGEYRGDVCIYPIGAQFVGVTDPFVAHQRHLYRYQGGRITQEGFTFQDFKLRSRRKLCPWVRQQPLLGRSKTHRLLAEDAAIRGGPGLCYGDLHDAVSALPLCTFFPVRAAKAPVTHILSKALPQRCQYRNMAEVCREYCERDATIREWMMECLECSLLGYYPHSLSETSPAAKRGIILGLRALTAPQWTAWVRNNGYLIFYVIKEYIVWIIRYDIALYETVCRHLAWGGFEASCIAAMDTVKEIISQNPPGDLFRGVRQCIVRVNAFQLRHLYRIPKLSFEQTLFEAFRRLEGAEPLAPAQAACVEAGVRCMAHAPLVPMAEWLGCVGVSPAGVAAWRRIVHAMKTEDASLHHFVSRIKTLPQGDMPLIQCFVRKYFEQQAIQLFDLPAHWYVAQCRALLRKYDCSGTELPPGCDTFYVCTSCRRFKAFLAGPETEHAVGHSKMIIDWETGDYMCACKPTKRGGFYFKEQQATQCLDTVCVPVSLLGNVLQCYGKCYVLCPGCARPCVFDFWKYSGSGFRCGVCSSTEPPTRCLFCGAPGDHPISVGDNTRHLCAAHTVPGMGRVASEDEVIAAVRGRQRQFYRG